MTESGIIRTVKTNGYFVASNEPFNDAQLTWESRGVMGYLLSKPDGWIVRNQDLVNNGPAGHKKIEGILKNLKECGYMRRFRYQDEKTKQFKWVTEIYESPSINPEWPPKDADEPIPPKQDDGAIPPKRGDGAIPPKPVNGSGGHIVSTDLLNTETTNTITNVIVPADKDHPAIQAFRSSMQRYPRKNCYGDIAERIGTDPNRLELWGRVVRGWKLQGWNPANYNGMFEFVDRGEIPQGKVIAQRSYKNGTHSNGTTQAAPTGTRTSF